MIDSLCGFGAERKSLGVHVVVFDEIGFDWAECTHSDVEGEEGVVEFGEYFGCEMQPGGGGGNGTFFAGEGGLIPIAIGAVAFPVHVVGEGELAVCFFIDVLVPLDDPVTIFQDTYHGACGVTNFHTPSDFHFFPRTNEAFPLMGAQFVGANEFDFPVIGKESGGGDFGVVEDQQVVWGDEAWEIGKHPVFDFTRITVHDE